MFGDAGAQDAAAARSLDSPVAVRPDRRIPVIDAIRGGALVAMFGYHFSWDLAYFGLIDGNLPLSPPFKAYAHAVASAFLVLVGISLVLARGRGAGAFGFVRRIAIIGTAAVAVSLVTRYLFPGDYIFFGILHCIAVSSLIALPFVTASILVTLLATILSLVLPVLAAAPFFDAPPLWWLGLGTHAPATFDYRPLFPWLGMVLFGVLAARCGLKLLGRLSAWAPTTPIGRLLVWGGRRSLLVYLLHQPILLGGLYLAVVAAGVHRPAEAASFARACEAQCTGTEAARRNCSASCACLAARLEESDFQSMQRGGRDAAAEEQRFRELLRACDVASTTKTP